MVKIENVRYVLMRPNVHSSLKGIYPIDITSPSQALYVNYLLQGRVVYSTV